MNAELAAALAALTAEETAEVAWARAAHASQWPPKGGWATWVFLGGRGAGKTRAGAEWLASGSRVAARMALVGPTLHDVREVMVDGVSGLRALPRFAGGDRPRYEPSRRRLLFPSGAVGYAFSAEDPDSLRGPQFGLAWADEFCAWAHPEATLSNLRLGLRLGEAPRLMVSTTPRPMAALRRLLAEHGTARTQAGTGVNAAHLSAGFVDGVRQLYGGTRLEAQEIEGRVLEAEGAMFRRADLDAARGMAPAGGRAGLELVVVAVDPPAGMGGAACGIVAAGRAAGVAYVLADRTARGLTPGGWAARVAATAAEFGADRVVAEANQGGEMVRSVLKTAGVTAPVRLVHAALGKRERAEPVALLYEQGRVAHCGAFAALEEELLGLGEGKGPSPDRADALVWAVSELLLAPRRAGPRVSVL